MKIIQIDASEVWTLLKEGYEINMVDDESVVYYINGVPCDTAAGWIDAVESGEKKAAFFYLVG